ncbi:MAG: hypothetical protein K0S71_2907 [Clostridia bacterium]|jgi:hypothetical protein|nr:hypothetical protein [Clostridia bacterium]
MTFVKSMIITSVIGFSVLMVTMFIGIKYYVDKNSTSSNVQTQTLVDKEEQPKVEYSSNMLALVRKITEDNLIAFDIEKGQVIDKNITVATKVSDGYGAAIPLASIQPGDIVEVTFQQDKQKILCINKTSRSWIKPDISGIVVDPINSKLTIGKKVYNFTRDAMIFKENGRTISPSFVGEYDILELQGVEDTVWSIEVLKSAASIELIDLPKTEGMLEIDRTRMIPLHKITEPISITPGKHKILIDIEGYESIAREINVIPEERYQISLKSAKEAFTELNLIVANQEADYTVEIGDNTFKKGDKISVKQDKYTIIVKSEGYKDWQQEVKLNEKAYDLNVMLQKEEDETTSPDPDSTNGTVTNGGTNNTNNSVGATYTINISSEPAGAYVYIGGIYRGQTPYKTTLPVGDYAVLLEKDGYETYNTNIIIDNSDNQNSFLYVLTKQ